MLKIVKTLTLSDTGFFGLQKHGGGGFFDPSPHPNFCSRDVQTWSVVSLAVVEFISSSKYSKL